MPLPGMVRLLTLVLLWSVLSPAALAGNDEKRESEVFSNEDLERYSREAPLTDNHQGAAAGREGAREQKLAEIKKQDDQQYWCKKAKPYRRSVEKAAEDLRAAEQELSEEKSKNIYLNKRLRSLEARVERLKKKSEVAWQDLNDFENEAYRKGVPPGWLRCQFE